MGIQPGGLLTNEQGKSRERKTAGDVVDHVYLTEIEAGFQGLQRNVNLKDDGFAIGGGDFVRHDGFRFIDFRRTLEKFDAG